MTPTPLSAAKSDPRLSAAAWRVLVLCRERESDIAPKCEVVARECRMDQATAFKAIRRLTETGYLRAA